MNLSEPINFKIPSNTLFNTLVNIPINTQDTTKSGAFSQEVRNQASKLQATVFFDRVLLEGKCDPSITHEEALRRIENGAEIAKKIILNDASDQPNSASKENVRDLVWFITAQSFEREGAPFARGTTRIMDENSHLLVEYMKSCKDSYSRISSHYKEIVVGKQYGINFKDGELPYKGLKTILFAVTERPGEKGVLDMFIKQETEGFCFTKDPLGTIRHGINWFLHTLSGGGTQNAGGEKTRRETDIKNLTNAFQTLIKHAVATGALSNNIIKGMGGGIRLFGIREKFKNIKKNIEQLISDSSDKPNKLERKKSVEKEETSTLLADNKTEKTVPSQISFLKTALDNCRQELDELAEAFPENTNHGHVRFGKESIIKLFQDSSYV